MLLLVLLKSLCRFLIFDQEANSVVFINLGLLYLHLLGFDEDLVEHQLALHTSAVGDALLLEHFLLGREGNVARSLFHQLGFCLFFLQD